MNNAFQNTSKDTLIHESFGFLKRNVNMRRVVEFLLSLSSFISSQANFFSQYPQMNFLYSNFLWPWLWSTRCAFLLKIARVNAPCNCCPHRGVCLFCIPQCLFSFCLSVHYSSSPQSFWGRGPVRGSELHALTWHAPRRHDTPFMRVWHARHVCMRGVEIRIRGPGLASTRPWIGGWQPLYYRSWKCPFCELQLPDKYFCCLYHNCTNFFQDRTD